MSRQGHDIKGRSESNPPRVSLDQSSDVDASVDYKILTFDDNIGAKLNLFKWKITPYQWHCMYG